MSGRVGSPPLLHLVEKVVVALGAFWLLYVVLAQNAL